MATHPTQPPLRVIVFIQENKATDFYFPSLALWGAEIKTGGPLLAAPPDHDQPHDRSSWVHYKMGDYPALAVQLDNDRVIPYYSWLAKQFTFCDHHFSMGTNSTPGHLLAVGGQTPTLKNPPFGGTGPQWDMPSIFLHAQRAGLTWAAFPITGNYPVKYYSELNTPAALKNIHTDPAEFITLAKAGKLPQLVYAWAPPGADEHPPQKSDPQYIARGQQAIWERVDAVVQGGGWASTVFILTWDDWGGYADHVSTPDAERVADALHPNGFQVLGGSRVPLLVFGGAVMQGIDNTWHSHASILKTIIDLFKLPAFGVPRVDQAPSLAARVNAALKRPTPPSPGTMVTQPTAPSPRPKPLPPPPWTGPKAQALPDLVANGGKTIPAPTDGLVRPGPPPPPKP
jgi:Phosphoesterase family